MNLWHRLTTFFRLPLLPPAPPPQPPAAGRTFTLDLELQHSLQSLAEQEQRTPQEVAANLIQAALHSRQGAAPGWRGRPRRSAPARVSLTSPPRRAAARLGIPPATIKTHVHSILSKFEASNRHELRQLLAGWDFSAWEWSHSLRGIPPGGRHFLIPLFPL